MADLHGKIMNIPCNEAYPDMVQQFAYKTGHRDARHAAAELAAKHQADFAAERDALAARLAEAERQRDGAYERAAQVCDVAAIDILAPTVRSFDEAIEAACMEAASRIRHLKSIKDTRAAAFREAAALGRALLESGATPRKVWRMLDEGVSVEESERIQQRYRDALARRRST